jgi:hypothetical protein
MLKNVKSSFYKVIYKNMLTKNKINYSFSLHKNLVSVKTNNKLFLTYSKRHFTEKEKINNENVNNENTEKKTDEETPNKANYKMTRRITTGIRKLFRWLFFFAGLTVVVNAYIYNRKSGNPQEHALYFPYAYNFVRSIAFIKHALINVNLYLFIYFYYFYK